MIDRFREEVYQSFAQRADVGLYLIDAEHCPSSLNPSSKRKCNAKSTSLFCVG